MPSQNGLQEILQKPLLEWGDVDVIVSVICYEGNEVFETLCQGEFPPHNRRFLLEKLEYLFQGQSAFLYI